MVELTVTSPTCFAVAMKTGQEPIWSSYRAVAQTGQVTSVDSCCSFHFGLDRFHVYKLTAIDVVSPMYRR